MIEKASDSYYNKKGYEPDIVYINRACYLQLLREKEDLRSIMGKHAPKLKNRIVLGLEVRLHRSKKIKVKSFKK